MDPRVPVVDVAVQPQPVPVKASEEGLDDTFVRFLPDAAAQARGPVVQLFTEDVVQPGELGRNLAGTQVQVRPGLTGHLLSGAGKHIIVRRPTPRALLAQEVGAVDDLVEPVGRFSFRFRSRIRACVRVRIRVHIPVGEQRHDNCPGEALLAGGYQALVGGAVAVAEIAGVVRDEGLRPLGALLLTGLPAQRRERRSGNFFPGSVPGRPDPETPARSSEEFRQLGPGSLAAPGGLQGCFTGGRRHGVVGHGFLSLVRVRSFQTE
jgi:hypothetical protein